MTHPLGTTGALFDATASAARLSTFTISHTKGVTRPVGDTEATTIADLATLAKGKKAPAKEQLHMIIAGTFGPSRAERTETTTCRPVSRLSGGDYDGGRHNTVGSRRMATRRWCRGRYHHVAQGTWWKPAKVSAPRWRVICPLFSPVPY